MKPPYTMNKGGALRIRRPDENGAPEVVNVSQVVAKRAKWLRCQYMTLEEASEWFAVFKDPKTGEVYGQPTGEE